MKCLECQRNCNDIGQLVPQLRRVRKFSENSQKILGQKVHPPLPYQYVYSRAQLRRELHQSEKSQKNPVKKHPIYSSMHGSAEERALRQSENSQKLIGQKVQPPPQPNMAQSRRELPPSIIKFSENYGPKSTHAPLSLP